MKRKLHKHAHILLMFGCVCFDVNAQNIDAQQQEARLFFDAADFNRAANQYTGLLDAPLLPWQQAVITYDLGTTQLAQGNWAEALKTFQSINLDTPAPLLSYRLHINMALARLLLAKAQSEALDLSDDILKDYSDTIRKLQEAGKEIIKAEASWCQLSKAGGASACRPSIEVDEMRREVEHLYAKIPLRSLQNDQTIQARIYAEEARRQSKLLSQNLNTTSKKSPKMLLKHMIEAQEHALLLNRLRLSMEGIESPNADIDKLIERSQSYTFQPTEAFYQAVMAQQKEDWQSLKEVSKDEGLIPWDEVLQPFENGVQSAQQAKKLLVASNVEQRDNAITFQEKTLAAWKEAFAKMQKKKKSDIKQKEEQQPAPTQPEEKPMQEPGGSTLNDVLRSLQEMENDDRSQPHFKSTPANKEIERPW